MRPAYWQVGELARQTGLTVRTLHHYDEIGLLSPSHRSRAGYRLYAAGDIVRLQQIRSLRQLGFSLQEIRACLDRPEYTPQRVIDLHVERLREQIERQLALCERLEALAAWLRSAGEVPAEAFTQTIEVMSMVEKYYTPEQLAYLKERAAKLGEQHIREVEAEWPRLIAQVRAEMGKGTDPADERVQQLVRRWQELVLEFTGGNPEIEGTVSRMYQQEEGLRQQTGIDRKLFEYVGKAMEVKK